MSPLTSEERLRYERQVMMPQVGETGQEKLKEAKIFIAGLGGLGSVSAIYMAAAGIGSLRIADRDKVTHGNLNRQILHHTPDIGLRKTESALEKLKALNPECRIEAIYQAIDFDNIVELVADSDIIMDGTDNIATRRALNFASVRLGIPFIYGGVNQFDGTVSTFIPGLTPCFECLFQGIDDKPGPVGIIGPVPALVASIQSLEAIKLILCIEELLTNQLLFIRGTDLSIKRIKVNRNPDCGVCGPKQ